MSDTTNYHMSTADFRRHGYALIDWIANYLDSVEDKPVSSQVEPGAIRSMIPDHAPEERLKGSFFPGSPREYAYSMAFSNTAKSDLKTSFGLTSGLTSRKYRQFLP